MFAFKQICSKLLLEHSCFHGRLDKLLNDENYKEHKTKKIVTSNSNARGASIPGETTCVGYADVLVLLSVEGAAELDIDEEIMHIPASSSGI